MTELSFSEVRNRSRYRDLVGEDNEQAASSLVMMGAVTGNFCCDGLERNLEAPWRARKRG